MMESSNPDKEQSNSREFSVDPCFDEPIDRLFLNDDSVFHYTGGQPFPTSQLLPSANTSYQNYDANSIYTFEEFINRQSPVQLDKGRGEALNAAVAAPPEVKGKPINQMLSINSDLAVDEDGFYNVALGPKVPDDPRSPLPLPASTNDKGRSSAYLPPSQPQPQQPPFFSTSVLLRQTFCPTVSARSSTSSITYGGGGGGDGSASSHIPPESTQQSKGGGDRIGGGSTATNHPNQEGRAIVDQELISYRRFLTTSFDASQGGGSEEEGNVPAVGDDSMQMNGHSTTIPNHFSFASWLCCLGGRTGGSAAGGSGTAEKYESTNYFSSLKQQHEPSSGEHPSSKVVVVGAASPLPPPTNNNAKVYSWDMDRPDPKNFQFANIADEVLIKGAGAINGQQFSIENCIDCLIILLDHTASITVDDCKNCIIILGPCKGSLFIRDCSNCTIYALCQQFRSRDTHDCQALLLCATAPAIEASTNWSFSPLWISYAGLEEQMLSAGLSTFANRWNRIHNFTPEAGQFTLSFNGLGGSEGGSVAGFAVQDKLRQLLLKSPPSAQSLSLHPEESYLLNCHPDGNKPSSTGDRILVLVKNLGRGQLPLGEFQRESMALLRSILRLDPTITLRQTAEIELRAGELEGVINLVVDKGKGKKAATNTNGRVIVFEFSSGGEGVRPMIAVALSKGSPQAELVDAEKTNEYKSQLYRLCDIQYSI